MLKLTLDDAKAIRMRSRDMIANNTGRNKMYREIERMEHAEYELPQEVRGLPGVHKVVSTDPHDAVRAATRVLSSIFPRIKYHPLSDGEAGKERASEIEQVLRWWFKGLNRRGNATILRDIVRSAVMYDMVAFQSVFIPHEEAAQKTLKGEAGEARKKFIMRRGPFAWRLHNPKTVFPMYSDYGLEAVLVARTMRAHEVISFWGDQAKEFKEMIVGGTGTYAEQAEAFTAGDSAIDDTTPEFRKVTVFDYTDSVNRYVWVTPNAMLSELSVVPTEGVPIMNPTPHGLGFIPWVCVSGGTSMESQSEHRYKPMLYSVVQSGQFETQVITDTLVMTEALLNFTSARRKDSGPNPDSIDEVYEDGSSVLKVPAGHTSEVIDKPQLDQNLLLLADRLASRMDKSTVSRILMGGGVPGETTFSAMNLMTQTAVGAIKPYQELAELAIAEGLTQMLLWVAEQDDETEVPAYQLDERMKMSGSQFTLMPNQIEPEAIYIDVKLEADAPTDKIQRVNAANLARGFGYPKVRALEDIGVTDPDVALRQSYTEDIQETLIATEKEKIIARAQLEIQALVSGAQQAMMPQPDQQPVDEGQPAAVGQDGIPLIGGPGFDPAQGGTPPAVAAPEVTRETQTGTARDGAEIA